MKSVRTAVIRVSLLLLVMLNSLWTLTLPVSASPAVLSPSVHGLTISPTSESRSINPGKVVKGSLQVIGEGTVTATAKVYVTPYSVSGENYKQSFSVPIAPEDASHWFTLDSSNLRLQPHVENTINYTITVPANTGPGGYYAAVFAEITQPAAPGGGILIHQRVGTLFYLQVNGMVRQEGKLLSWDVSPIQTTRPLTAYARMANKGNVYYSADIVMNVKGLLGSRSGSVDTTHYVLQNTTRKIIVPWQSAGLVGLYRVGGTVHFIGRTQVLPDHYVLLMPVGIALVIALLLVIIIGGSIAAFRHRRR